MLMEDIQIEVYRSTLKIPAIFFVPATIALSLYAILYLFLNSNFLVQQLQERSQEYIPGQIAVGKIITDSSLTNFQIIGAKIRSASGAPIVESGTVQFGYNPLLLFAKRFQISYVNVSDARVHIGLEDRVNLLRALGLYEEKEVRDDNESSLKIDLGIKNISIVDSYFSYSMDHMRFKIADANIIGAELDISDGELNIFVPEILVEEIPFHFQHEMFHLKEKWGDWEPKAEDVKLTNWRWMGDGFFADEISFELDGTRLVAGGWMNFPNDVHDDQSVAYGAKARLSGPYWSRAVQYFVKDFAHVDAEFIDLEVIGDLGKVDLLADYSLNQLDAYGLQFFNVKGTFELDNQYISMGKTTGRVAGGKMDVNSAFYDMYTGVFGANFSAEDVDPYTSVKAFGFEYPYLEGVASGTFQVTGHVPYEDTVGKTTLPLLGGFTDAARPLISLKLLKDATYERISSETLPGKKFRILKGAEVWSQVDRVGVPKAILLSELGRFSFKDFVLHYDRYEIERTLRSRKMQASIESDDMSKLVDFYGGSGVAGRLKLNVDALGRLNYPEVNLSMEMDRPKLAIAGVEWIGERIGLTGNISNGRFSISDLTLVGNSGRGEINGHLALLADPKKILDEKGLTTKDFQYPLENEANLNVNLSDLHLKNIANSAGLDNAMNPSGLMDVEGKITGSLQRPDGELAFTGKKIELFGQNIPNLESVLRFTDDGGYAFQETEVDLGRAGLLRGKISGKGEEIEYDISGKDIELQHFEFLKETELSARGKGDFRVYGKGTYDNPNAGGFIRIDDVEVIGRDLGDLALVINTLDSTIHLSGALLPWVTVDAEIPLSDEAFYARFGIDDINISDAVSELRALNIIEDSSASGMVELFLERDFSRYQILVNLADLRVSAFGKEFRNQGPVVAGLNEGRLLQIQNSRVGVDGKYLDIHGGVFLDQSLVDLVISGDMDLSLLNGVRLAFPAYMPEMFLEADGSARVDLAVKGPPEAIAANGNVRFDQSEFLLRGLSEPLILNGGRIDVNENQISVSRTEPIEGRMLGGLFSVGGTVGLDNMSPRDVDLSLSAQNFGYRIPTVADATFGADLRVRIGEFDKPESWLISGEVDILDALYYQNFSVLQDALTNRLLGTFTQSTERYDASVFERFPELADIGWDVNLVARDGVKIRNEIDRLGLDIELRLGLRLQNTLLEPNLTGEINLIGGLVKFQGEEFRVRTGILNFDGNPRNPTVDVIAEADIENACRGPENSNQGQTMTLSGVADQGEQQTYHVILNVSGSLDNMNIQFESNPFADQRDILSLMLTGCTVDQLTASSAGSPTLEVALGPVLGWIEGQVQDAVKVEEFTITPSFDRLKATVGDSITRRVSWRFQLDTGLTDSAGGQLGKVVYKISDEWSALLSESTSNNARSDESNFLIEVKLKYRLLID